MSDCTPTPDERIAGEIGQGTYEALQPDRIALTPKPPAPKIILLNGPPRCGKDTLGRMVTTILRNSIDDIYTDTVKFADPLKEMTHGLYMELDDSQNRRVRPWWSGKFEDRKDEPCEEFLGATPRQAYIAVSEKLMKPLHGDDVFGRLLVKNIYEMFYKDATPPFCDVVLAVTDSGFEGEAQVLVDAYGAENVALVRITREGCSFAGDSRGYINIAGVRTYIFCNEGTLFDLWQSAAGLASSLTSLWRFGAQARAAA